MSDWMYDHAELVVTIGVIIFSLVVLIGTINFYSWSCDQRASAMNLPHYYRVTTGCMIQVNNQWLPLEAYRFVD